MPQSAVGQTKPSAHPLRLLVLLVVVAALGFVGAIPYLVPVVSAALANTPASIPLPLVLLAQGAQLMVLVAIAAFAGIRLAPRLGLDAPFLRALADRETLPSGASRITLEALLVGTFASVLTAVVLLLLRPYVPETLWTQEATPSFWVGASSAFYGGTIEEILMRWGVLTSLFALARKLGMKNGFWTANILSTLLFGLGHLPALGAAGVSLRGGVFAYVLLGNGIAGLIFGVLFRRRGLEAAMVSHGCADIWLHAVLPALLPRA